MRARWAALAAVMVSALLATPIIARVRGLRRRGGAAAPCCAARSACRSLRARERPQQARARGLQPPHPGPPPPPPRRPPATGAQGVPDRPQGPPAPARVVPRVAARVDRVGRRHERLPDRGRVERGRQGAQHLGHVCEWRRAFRGAEALRAAVFAPRAACAVSRRAPCFTRAPRGPGFDRPRPRRAARPSST
jgi:hypothetical protein